MQLDSNMFLQHAHEMGKKKNAIRFQGKVGANSNIKFKQKPDGSTVKLRRVRRKKKAAQAAPVNPATVFGTDRVTLGSELNQAAPVQSKPNAIWAKRPRYRSTLPGLGKLVSKAVR